MKILLTGVSSFTGMWFVRELAARGHQIVAPLLRHRGEYSGVRSERVAAAASSATLVDSCPFGSDAFLSLIDSHGPWDLLCHHAAVVTDYKSADFDAIGAAADNSARCKEILATLGRRGCRHLLLTGSIFEQREGVGSHGAVSPYGLSKGLTSDIFSYYSTAAGWTMGKFVIPNPFGPYEEERYTAFLMHQWSTGTTARVAYPDYIRDNIHVTLLAKGYALFAEQVLQSARPTLHRNPSGYVESLGAFTERFAAAMQPRLGWECRYQLETQTLFSEPRERYNSEPLAPTIADWNEGSAWDGIANYYKEKLCPQ